MNIRRYSDFPSDTAIAIGSFDGVHLGHRQVISRLHSIKRHLKPIVVTFAPTPREFFKKDMNIMNLREKVQALTNLEIRDIVLLPFAAMRHMEADQFFTQVLCGQIRAKHIVVGEGFCFGKDRLGGVETLISLGKQYGVVVDVVNSFYYQQRRVSSTWIRELLTQGNLEQANILLGNSYHIIGRVVKGAGRGTELGFATANIALNRNRCIATGVYIARVLLHNKYYFAVANIGRCPSFSDSSDFTLEVHIFDLQANLYGEILQVEMLKKLRDEIEFTSTDNLVVQINQDIDTAKEWINNQ